MKKALKRTLSLCLAIVMLCALVVVPASAATDVTFGFGEWKEAGGKYTLTITASGAGASFETNMLQCIVAFDNEKLVFESITGSAEGLIFSGPRNENAINKANTDGSVSFSLADLAAAEDHTISSGATIATLTFAVHPEAETGTASFSFSSTKAQHGASVDYTVAAAPAKTVNFTGATPTIASVALSSSSVEVNGTAGGSITATATSAKGTNITSGVTWSVIPAGQGVTINSAGAVTVDSKAQAGEYTVTAAAKTGTSQGANKTASLTVTRAAAAAKTVAVSGAASVIVPTGDTPKTETYTAEVRDQYGDVMSDPSITWAVDPNNAAGVTMVAGTLSVTNAADADRAGVTVKVKATVGSVTGEKQVSIARAAAVATNLTISGGSDSLTVPADGVTAPATSNAFTAEVRDQYGAVMSNPTVTWSVRDGANTVTGVTIQNGVVSVTNAAKAAITNETGKQLTVTATCGTATKTATITVKRAASVVTQVTIDTTPSATIAKPVGSAQAKNVTYTAKVFDQYGDVMNDQNVTWTNTNALANVTVADNVVTVPTNAATGTFKLTATCGEKKDEITISVVDIEFTGVDAGITTKAATYGMTWGDIITVTSSRITAKVGNTTVTGTYTVTNATQRPAAGSQTGSVTFTSTDGAYQNIPVVSKTVNVAKKAITVTAEDKSRPYGNANPTLTWTVKDTDLVGSDTKAVLNVTLNCAANATTPVGKADITGTGTADNYAITVTKGTLTITPVKVTAVQGVPATLTLSKAQVTGAADLKALGLAEKVTLSFSDGVANAEVAASYDKELAAIKAVANTVTATADKTVEVTLTNACFPAYADKAGSTVTMPKTTITITNKYVIPEADITIADVTAIYGAAYTPTASVASKAEYSGVKFAYTYTDKDGKAVAEPKNVGTYTITVTVENDNYKGTKTAKLTIEPKELEIDWVTLTIPEGGFVYDGKAKTPAVAVKDGETVLKAGTDYTVTYKNNVNAGTAQGGEGSPLVTIKGKGNYTMVIGKNFAIAKAPLTEVVPTVSGTAKAGNVLSAAVSGVIDAPSQLTWKWYVVTTTGEGDEATTTYTPITDATSISYAVKVTDSNKVLAVQAAAAENGNYTGTTAYSKSVTVAKTAIHGQVTVTETNKTGGEAGKIEIGDTLTAAATVTPNVDVAYQWYNNGKAIEDATGTAYVVKEGDAKLTVTVTPADENYEGSVTSTALEVGKTAISGTVTLANENGIITATVSGAAAETYDIVWLRDGAVIAGQSETAYTLTAADKGHTVSAKLVGKGDYTGEVIAAGINVPAEAPAAPVARASAGNGQVTVSWTAPADNGAAITGYTVAMTVPEAKSVTLSAAATSYTFTGLTNDTEYTFTVKAVNTVGAGAASEAVKATPKASSGGNGGGGGGGVAPADTTQTVTNPDGSKTTIVTSPDGTVKETTVATDGTKTEVTTKPDGSATSSVTQPNGVKAQATTTAEGETTAKVTVPNRVDEAKVTIPVKNVTPGTVAVLVKPDGTEEVLKTSVATDKGIAVKLAESAQLKIVDKSKAFEDTTGHWAKSNVDFVTARDLFQGTTETTFAPNAVMTRGMLVTVLYRLDGERKGDVTASFADVAEGTWYTDAVAWGAESKVVEGKGNNTFAPNDNITREQLAAMVYRYAKTLGYGYEGEWSSKLDFNDTEKVSDWSQEAVNWLVDNGILTGKPGKLLDPQGSASRAEVATVLQRFVEYLTVK